MPRDRLHDPAAAPPLTPDRDAWREHGVAHEWDPDPRSWPERDPGVETRFGPFPRQRDVRPAPNSELWAPPDELWTLRTYAGLPQVGPHVGRGPKGWRRSDERIAEDVNRNLTRDPHVDATLVEVRVHRGEVTLEGSVTDRAQKRRAEDCADDVDGVVDVHNRLRIAPAEGEFGTEERGGTRARRRRAEPRAPRAPSPRPPRGRRGAG